MSSHLPRSSRSLFLSASQSRGVPLVIFDPHPSSCVVSQSKRMIQVPGHVLNVAVQAHARVEEHGDGRPGALRKAAAEKAVDGCAGLPQARGIGDPDHPAVPEKCGPGASSPPTTGPAAARDLLRRAFPWRSGTPAPCFILTRPGPLSSCHSAILSLCSVFQKTSRKSPRSGR